jgi:hypothetical protein
MNWSIIKSQPQSFMSIVQMLDTGYAHTAALAASVLLGYFLSSGDPVLTLTVGAIGKLLYSDLVSFANA